VQRAELQDDSHGELVQERRYVPTLPFNRATQNESFPFPAGTALQTVRRCTVSFHTAE
jgi:hypothetical protein